MLSEHQGGLALNAERSMRGNERLFIGIEESQQVASRTRDLEQPFQSSKYTHSLLRVFNSLTWIF